MPQEAKNANAILPPPPTTLRKIIRIGHSRAITLPRNWFAAHVDPAHPYAIVSTARNGCITITACTNPALRSLAQDDPAKPD